MVAANLLDSLSQGIGPQFTQYGERLLGIPHGKMESVFAMALPAVFAGVMQKAASFRGAESLMHTLERPDLNSNIATNLDSYLGGGDKTTGLASLGQSMMPDIFGSKTGNLLSTIASVSGLKMESASRLMALAVPTVLSFLKGLINRDHLDARSLSNLLSEQGTAVSRSLDPRLANALGAPSPAAFIASLQNEAQGVVTDVNRGGQRVTTSATYLAQDAVRSTRETVSKPGLFGNWWAWAILAAVGFFLATQLGTCFHKAEIARAPSTVTNDRGLLTFNLPDGRIINAPENGAIANLIQGLQRGALSIGANYELDELHFDTGSASIKTNSLEQLDQLAKVMNAYPAVEVLVRGYTDSTGDAVANQKLSSDRAEAVKMALTDRGVAGTRVATAGMGEAGMGAATEGQSSSAGRRVEIVVTKH